MRKLLSVFCALLFVTVINCGSTGSSSSLTTTQVNAISAALTGALTQSEAYTESIAGINGVSIDSTTLTCNNSTLSCSGTVNETYPCASAGHITVTGNMHIYCTDPEPIPGGGGAEECASGVYHTSILVVFHVSDATNNLNDCDVGGGTILDGTINLTVAGDNAALTANLDGTIDIDNRGPTGGLVPIANSCGIFVTFNSNGTASGTICGNTVSTATPASVPEVQF